MANFTNYWRKVLARAGRETAEHIGWDTAALLSIVTLALAIVYALVFGGLSAMTAEWGALPLMTWYGVLAFVTIGVIVFLRNLFRAPALIHAEAEALIDAYRATRATLEVSGPTLRHPADQRVNQWRIVVRNKGPATASNVQIRLVDISPRPADGRWLADYPYRAVVKSVVGDPQYECRINHGDEGHFEIVSGWLGSDELHTIAGLDTKHGATGHIRLQQGERWAMKYEVRADNAPSIDFIVSLFGSGEAVMVERAEW